MVFDQLSRRMRMPSQSNFAPAGISGRRQTDLISCEECKRVWTDPLAHWSLFVAVDLDEVEVHAAAEAGRDLMAAFYCPQCASREFGDNRRRTNR
jgi:hypothetical protein